jgi:hypothetical protein
VQDSINVPDVQDVPDMQDVPDVQNSIDVPNVPDVQDVLNVQTSIDVPDVQNVPKVQDVPRTTAHNIVITKSPEDGQTNSWQTSPRPRRLPCLPPPRERGSLGHN